MLDVDTAPTYDSLIQSLDALRAEIPTLPEADREAAQAEVDELCSILQALDAEAGEDGYVASYDEESGWDEDRRAA